MIDGCRRLVNSTMGFENNPTIAGTKGPHQPVCLSAGSAAQNFDFPPDG
jgi:hypothetical protein